MKMNVNSRIITTSLAWAFLGALVGWAIVATGWWLLATLWRQELFIPVSVKSTALTMLVIVLWGVVVTGAFLLWANYNYRRYYLHSKRKTEPLSYEAPLLQWKEAIFTAEGQLVPVHQE